MRSGLCSAIALLLAAHAVRADLKLDVAGFDPGVALDSISGEALVTLDLTSSCTYSPAPEPGDICTMLGYLAAKLDATGLPFTMSGPDHTIVGLPTSGPTDQTFNDVIDFSLAGSSLYAQPWSLHIYPAWDFLDVEYTGRPDVELIPDISFATVDLTYWYADGTHYDLEYSGAGGEHSIGPPAAPLPEPSLVFATLVVFCALASCRITRFRRRRG